MLRLDIFPNSIATFKNKNCSDIIFFISRVDLSDTVLCSVFHRCEDMVDVRRLKMLQMVQLFKCEEDAAQVRLMV